MAIFPALSIAITTYECGPTVLVSRVPEGKVHVSMPDRASLQVADGETIWFSMND